MKYDKEYEKELEKKWEDYQEWCPPVRYEKGETKKDDIKEWCRRIFVHLYDEDETKTGEYYRKALNCKYAAKLCDSYWDGNDLKTNYSWFWRRCFSLTWNGLDIEIWSEAGTIARSLFDDCFHRYIHVSDWWCKITYKGILLKDHDKTLKILEKLYEDTADRMDTVEAEFNNKIEELTK